jgi:hypothetical protein
MALCTSSDVEYRLGGASFTTTEAVLVGELIDAAQGHIEREAQRDLEAAAQTETFDPPESTDLWLTHTPINSITSVTVDGTALSSSQYSHDPETGRLTRVVNGRPVSWRTFKVQSIVVVYNGGYTTVPNDLVDLCARMAARAYQAGESAAGAPSAGVKQINLAGSDSVTFASESTDVTAATFMTDDEIEVARYYRNRVLA